MTDQREKVTNVDGLLRRALADDLPEDVAAALRRQFAAFGTEARIGARPSPARVLFLPRAAWAALSILMLLAGILLQGAKASSPLANRISSLKAAYTNLGTTRR